MQITQITADEFLVDAALQSGTTDAGVDNMKALDAAFAAAGPNNGTVQLPAVTFYFANTNPNRSVLVLDERSAGITIRGAGRGKTLLVPMGTGETIYIVSTLIPYFSFGRFLATGMPTDVVDEIPDIANYAVDDLMYFWKFNESGQRSDRQLLTIIEVNDAEEKVVLSGAIGVGLPDKPTNFKHIKGARVLGAVARGTRTIQLVEDHDALMFVPGDDVVIGDGPGASQFFGEWATVAAVEPSEGRVTLAAGVRRSYDAGLTCLVPGRPTDGPGSPRQHLADVTLRDFSVAGALLSTSLGQVRLAVRMQIVNVGFGAAEPANDPDPNTVSYNIALAECGRLTMRDCYLDGGLRCTVGQDIVIDNFVARSITNEEYGIDYEFVNCTTNLEFTQCWTCRKSLRLRIPWNSWIGWRTPGEGPPSSGESPLAGPARQEPNRLRPGIAVTPRWRPDPGLGNTG